MSFHIRDARPEDVRTIAALVRPYAARRILVSKELIHYFEDVQEFIVAEDTPGGPVIGCGALHVMWDDIAEVRTLAVDPAHLHRGIGSALLETLVGRARRMGLMRTFCLTFEVSFFSRHGFRVIEGTPVGEDVFTEMLRSHDDGVKEFLDLASVKPNTLGNTRMILDLVSTDPLPSSDPLPQSQAPWTRLARSTDEGDAPGRGGPPDGRGERRGDGRVRPVDTNDGQKHGSRARGSGTRGA